MIQSTVDMLRAMKMTAMAAELERQTGDASYRELNTEERLSLIHLMDACIIVRQVAKKPRIV